LVIEYRDTPPVIVAGATVEPAPQIVQNLELEPCPVRCGDGVVDTGETCDDGNEDDGDCCSAACTPAAAGSTCDDGRACTSGDACDGAGACVGQLVECSTCSHCDEGTGNCVSRPKPRCARMLAAGAGLFDVKAASGTFLWRWRRGAATPLAAFGDPLSSTDYDLCFYTPSDTVGFLGADHGPAWTARGTRGFRYLDQSAPEGTTRLKLLAGDAGRSSIELKGRAGASRLPVETPLTVQLQASNGACWTSQFSAPSTNLSHRFTARSD
jgi:cysteine-rich repeat protein